MNATPPPKRTLADVLRMHNKASLARELGVQSSTVARWARGETIPEATVLPKLAELVRLDLADLARIVAGGAA